MRQLLPARSRKEKAPRVDAVSAALGDLLCVHDTHLGAGREAIEFRREGRPLWLLVSPVGGCQQCVAPPT